MTALNNLLRAYRYRQGWTLKQLGERTGLSVSFLSDMERGRVNPSIVTLAKLATAYGTTTGDLIGNALVKRAIEEYTPASQPAPASPFQPICTDYEDAMLLNAGHLGVVGL